MEHGSRGGSRSQAQLRVAQGDCVAGWGKAESGAARRSGQASAQGTPRAHGRTPRAARQESGVRAGGFRGESSAHAVRRLGAQVSLPGEAGLERRGRGDGNGAQQRLYGGPRERWRRAGGALHRRGGPLRERAVWDAAGAPALRIRELPRAVEPRGCHGRRRRSGSTARARSFNRCCRCAWRGRSK